MLNIINDLSLLNLNLVYSSSCYYLLHSWDANLLVCHFVAYFLNQVCLRLWAVLLSQICGEKLHLCRKTSFLWFFLVPNFNFFGLFHFVDLQFHLKILLEKHFILQFFHLRFIVSLFQLFMLWSVALLDKYFWGKFYLEPEGISLPLVLWITQCELLGTQYNDKQLSCMFEKKKELLGSLPPYSLPKLKFHMVLTLFSRAISPNSLPFNLLSDSCY